ncbi:MAG: hypothetical protein ACR2LL_02840 [Nitrosopumilus sp.]
MRLKCYFCNIWLNNSVSVRVYDGMTVESCHVCRGLVADTKSSFDLSGHNFDKDERKVITKN